MDSIKKLLFLLCFSLLIFTSCNDLDYGANPYDPNTPITVSQMPKISSFEPNEGKTGDIIQIKGVNFSTATNVTFGGKAASSFEVKSDELIEAVVGPYGGTGAVGVTNHKGTKTLDGFLYLKEEFTDNPNLALSQPVTASTTLTPASLGVDGDINTRWSAENEDNQWYQVDLQRVYSINTIIIRWEAAYASEFEVEVSTDNVNFTSIYSTNEGIGGTDSITFDNRDARYVKIVLKTRGTPWAMSFWELEIYNTPPPVNLALNKTATGAVNFNDPGLGIDGDLSTRWSAESGDNHWYQVDLGKEFKVGRVNIFWEGAYASEYAIQLSSDNVNFTTVYSTNSATGGDVEHTFTQTDARYVKMLLIKAGTPWNMSFWEFEVYEK